MKKFRLVLLAAFFMLVLMPVKAEAKATYTYRPKVYVAVGETRSFNWSTFRGNAHYIEYYSGNVYDSGPWDSEIATASYWNQPYVTITGHRCGVTHMSFGLYDKAHNYVGTSMATIKVIKKPKMTGKSIMDIQQSAKFKVKGIDAVKWWSKDKKVATVSKTGVVKTKKTGKTVIYVKSKGGKTYAKTLAVKHTKHKYTKTKTVKPTCTRAGYKVKKCKCGKEGTKTSIKKLGHKLNETAVSATCESGGFYSAWCERCSYKKEEEFKALGHDYAVISSRPATCMEKGMEGRRCSRCNDFSIWYLPATGHKFGDYVVVKESTCIKNGAKARYCEKCSISETVALSLSGHDFVLNVKAPRCFEDGLQYNKCKVCGFVQDETVLPGGEEHVFSEGNAFTNYNQFLDSSFNDIGAEYICCDCGGTKEKRPVPRKDYASEITEIHTIESLSCFATDYWILDKDGLLFTANAFNGKEPVDDDGDWNITIGNTDDYLYRVTVNHLGGNEFSVQVSRGVLPEKYDTLDSVSTDESVKSITVNVPEYVGGISEEKNFKRYWHYESDYGLFLRPCFFDEYVFEDSWFPNGVSHEYYRGFPYQLR